MAVHLGTHPSADVLKAFGLGKLDDTATGTVMDHLDLCADCRKEVASQSGDDFLDRLRQAHGRSSTPAPAKALSPSVVGPKPSASHPAIPNLPPELANNPHYEILRELGRGGMGVVYLAKNKLMDRLEVLKVVNKALLDRPGSVERFLREIRSAAKLSHANVVAAYSALQMGELLAFAMEYVEGEDLAAVVKKQGPLPVAHACFYVQQAALGLQHAFEKKMVHRDIKPQNLMLAREGKKHIVKVLDFGLAKVMREKTDDTGLTGEGKMLGTPDYIAPEQTLDAASADIRADIYSLGCTLYYLLSGRPPFSANSLGAILMAHQMQESKLLNLVRSEVPEELASVVRKMMAKSVAKRYQTPLEVVQALSPFVKQGASPKSSPDLSVGTAKAAVVKAVKIESPAAPVPEAPPSAAWDSLTEGSITSAQPRKSGAVRKRKSPVVNTDSRKKWLMGGGIGVGVLLLALLGMWASGVFKVKTKDGTIVLENVPPDAEVFVDGETVTLKAGDSKAVTIGVTAGKKHQLQVKKEGFKVFGQEVEIEAGARRPITVRLEARSVPGKAAKAAAKRPVIQPSFRDDFDKTQVLDDVANMKRGFGEGAYYVESRFPGTGQGAINFHEFTDGIVEVRARVAKGFLGAWMVHFENFEHKHGIRILVSGDGQLWILPSLFDPKPESGPNEVHVRHSAIKPAGEWNTLRLVINGRTLGVYVNGERVCDPIATSFVIAPGMMALGNTNEKRNVRVEFDHYVLWPTTDIEQLPMANFDAAATGDVEAADKDFVPLFNGKDLSGWKTHPSQPGNWRVENGILTGSGPAISHLYSSDGDYKNFHLRVEARINDGGNGGVCFRTPFGPTIPANNPLFLSGYEAQINSTHKDINKTGSLYAVVSVASVGESPVPPGQWFTLEVIAEDNHLVIKVNGKTTVDYTDEKLSFTCGHIALQQHNAQTVAEFRKIEIKELPAKAAKK